MGKLVLVDDRGLPGSWIWPRRSSPDVVIKREEDALTGELSLTDQIVAGTEMLA